MSLRILLVEDNPENRDMLGRRLTRRNHQVSFAVDGAEALACVQAQRPDIVLMDLSLPVMDGWEVRIKMQEQHELSAIPVCVVTATPEWAPLDSVCVLTKPVDIGELLRVIETQLKSA